jgi:hypothetical protein
MDAGLRAELAQRVAAIDGREYLRPQALAVEVDRIRALAARAGMQPAVTIAYLLDGALARGESGALIHGWLHLLGEAVASGRDDEAAAQCFAAAAQVRIAG